MVDRTSRFAEIVAGDPARLPLDEAAALIAAHAYPDLDAGMVLRDLDGLAGQVREPTLDGLCRLLFRDLAFSGNRDEYYDPRNSYLNDVLGRRIGIPITLAVVTIEVGRRLSIPLDGVGMPGHFLVRDRVDRSVFVDVFGSGERLDLGGCERLFRATTGQRAFSTEFLEPISRPAIVGRMLANLEQIHQARRDMDSLGWVTELSALMPGADARRWSALAAIRSARGQYDGAADAFEEAAGRSTADEAAVYSRQALQARSRLN
jgi:regulator of sirC expression with transglutaminase-like and TPR domain